MRKQCKRRHIRATPPMLVNRGLRDRELSTSELMTVKAFTGGWATEEHFDKLTDMRNVLTIAAAKKDDESALNICEAMSIPLQNIRIRYIQTGRFGCTGDELMMMQAFVEFYRDFWLRQPLRLYEDSGDCLNRHWELVDADKRMAA